MRKKIIGIAFFVLCLVMIGIYFWGTRVDQNQARINKIFDIARKIRPAPIDKLKNLLVDYALDSDIKKTIINFLQKTIGQTFDESNIQQIQQSDKAAHKGLSGNPVFFIRDAKDNLKFVIKVFERPFDLLTGAFIKELSGFQIASTIKGKSFNFISAQAIGKCSIDNQQYGLLAISPATGTSIADLILRMSSLEHGSAERADAFRIMQCAFEKLGTALAEFHHIRAKKVRGIHPAVLKAASEYLYSIKLLLQDNHGIDFKTLKTYFYSLVYGLENVEITRSFVHGDTNLGNFIYDTKTDSISMIDLTELSQAADQEGNPIQNAIFDFNAIFEGIGAYLKSGMTEEEYTKLKAAFINAYGNISKNKGQKFFTLMYRLRSIMWASGFLEWKKDHPEKIRRGFKDWLQFALDKVKKSLSKFEENG